jgi:hypothetical protein
MGTIMDGNWRGRECIRWSSIRIVRFSLLCILITAICDPLCRSETTSKPTTTSTPYSHLKNDANTNNSSPTNTINNRHHLTLHYTEAGRIRIPGLYDDYGGFITPIQGQSQFDRLILGIGNEPDNDNNRNSTGDDCRSNITKEQESIRLAAQTETINLVQFYMASCPDCQGFSPYFKRFAEDIAMNWSKLVKIYTVNCNDFQNIHLCQEQNPRLIVPLVRWYVFPSIQRDSIESQKAGRFTGTDGNTSKFNYPLELLNIAHRQFIPKQRRDLISLRQATLRFIALTLDELSNDSNKIRVRHRLPKRNETQSESAKRFFYDSLPAVWHHFGQLGREQPDDLEVEEQFLGDLNERLAACRQSTTKLMDCSQAQYLTENSTSVSSSSKQVTMSNFIIFEDRRSFIGRTLMADWSSEICRAWSTTANATHTILVHRSTDLHLLTGSRFLAQAANLPRPILLAFNVTVPTAPTSTVNSIKELNFKLLAWNVSSPIFDEPNRNLKRARRAAQRTRIERVQQRALLEEYYNRLSGGSKVIHPIRYAAAMGAIGNPNSRVLPKRDTSGQMGETAHPAPHQEGRLVQQAEVENANWVPESVYPNEERLRYAFNVKINGELGRAVSAPMPGSLLRGQHPGEIPKAPSSTLRTVVDAAADDLTLMLLTDYYRGLDEIVHIDLVSKGDVDGYQLLASSCFLKDLEQHFPFQGNAHGSSEIGSKSIARHYIHLLQHAWLDELKARHLSKVIEKQGNVRNSSSSDNNDRSSSSLALIWQRVQEKNGCTRLAELVAKASGGHGNSSSVAANVTTSLDKVRVLSRELEQIQLKIKRTHNVGLAPERHLKWKYCAGSEPFLRGHTCSLWIIFHTLTVHEYLTSVEGRPQHNNSNTSEYKFQVDYSKPPRRPCDPNNPDEAYLSSKTSELFLTQTRFALANIINFVRYYLPCTNCAAHFSCMVEHSTGLNFGLDQEGSAEPDDSHLLWLWEAHNRVNERTRGTHSEDPTRPKHIFPSYKACPQCYLSPPQPDAKFTSMRFNRAELVRFLVARYRKSAILNNKINIEDLYSQP